MKKIHRFIVLVSVLAMGLASITVSTAQAAPETTVSDVRLITGDLVGLSAEGQVTTITPAPRPDGSTPQFSTSTENSQVYVIPDDVAALIPDQLDRELFNVTELTSYDLNDDVPIIVMNGDDVDSQAAQEVSNLGVEVTDSLDTLSTQVGLADVRTDSGPAPAWDLLQELATTPTSVTDPVSLDTKVWLDQQVHMDSSFVPLAVTTAPEPQWMSLIGKDEAHAEGYTGEGVKVAIVDSGVDANHPDFAGQIIAQQDFTGTGLGDPYGHGTFVASEVAGTGAASSGQYAGVAPDAKLIIARVLDGSGDSSSSIIMAGIEWAAKQGADIINLSIGFNRGFDDGTSAVSQLVNQVSQDYDCLIVVAAGNNGLPQTINAPGTADEALTVGATYQDGSFYAVTSNGPRRGDGAVKPELLAPGTASLAEGGIVGALANSGRYVRSSGTSMAAPLVSGAAALLVQEDPSLTHDQIRAKLMASATLKGDSIFQQGAGLLNIPAALNQSVTTTPTQLNLGTAPFPKATLTYVNAGSVDQTYTLTVTGVDSIQTSGDPVVIPLWIPNPATDAPLTVSAGTVTVPAGGRTSVEVTLNPAAFSKDYAGGYITATSASGASINTPVGWAKLAQTLTVTVTTDTTTATVGEPITATATVFADDAPVANAPVTFSAVSPEVTVTGEEGTSTCVTGEDGTCTVTITADTPGTYADEITAGINGMTPVVIGTPVTLTFTPAITVGLGGRNNIRFQSKIVNISMDSGLGIPAIVAWAADADGQLVDGVTIDFTLEGDSVSLETTSCVTGQDEIFDYDSEIGRWPGYCQVRVDVIQPGDSTLHGFYDGVEGEYSPMTIRVIPPSSQISQIQVTRTGQPADGVSEGIVTGWAYDALGHTVQGVDVSFSTESPGAELSSDVCTTGEDGSCFVTVTSTVAQAVIVHGFSDGQELLRSPAGVIFDPQTTCPALGDGGDDPMVSCYAEQFLYAVTGDGSSKIQAPAGTSVVVDLSVYQPSWTRPYHLNLDGVTLTYVIEGDHEATSQTCVTSDAGCEIVLTSEVASTVTVQPYIGDWALGSPMTITFTDETATPGDWLSVTPDSGSVVADGSSSWTGTVRLDDGDGEPITTASSQDIGFIVPDEVSVSDLVNHHDGTYTVSFTSLTPGEYDVTAYAAAASSDSYWPMPNAHATISFDPVPPPPPDPNQSSMSTSVSTVTVSYPACGEDPTIDPQSVTVSALIKDTDGQPMDGVTVDFLVTSRLTLTGASSVQTNADGVATTTVAVNPSAGGDAIVRASVNGVEMGTASLLIAVNEAQQPSWVPGMVVADTSTPVWADGQSSYTATVTAIDGCGVAVAGTEIRFSVTGGAHLTVASDVTDEHGVVTTTITDTTIEQVSLSAVAMIGGHSTTVNGSPVNLTFDDPQGPAAPTVLKANATQISGSAVPGTTVVVTYPTGNGTNTVEADANPSGAWTLPTPDDAIDGPLDVQARDNFGRLSASTDAHLDVTPPGAPSVAVANDSEISGTSEAKAWIQVVDADGTPLGSVAADGDGVWLVPTPDYAVPGEIFVTATDAAGNVSDPRTALLSIVPVSGPDPTKSTVSVPETTLVVGQTTCVGPVDPGSVTATAHINDGDGLPVPGVMVDFTVDAPLMIVGSASVETGPDGVAQVEVGVDPQANLLVGTTTGYVHATVAGVPMGTPAPVNVMLLGPVMFPPPPAPGEISAQLTVSSASIPVFANGTAAWTATVTVIDQCNLPFPNAEIQFSATGSASLSETSVLTDSTGRATTLVTSSEPGDVVISATATWLDEPVVVVDSPITVEFQAVPNDTPTPDPTKSTATLSTSHISVVYKNCGEPASVDPSSATIEVVVRDTTGAVLPGAQVDFSADSPLVLESAHAVADKDGIARIEVGVDTAGTLNFDPKIRISLGGVEIVDSPFTVEMSYAMPSPLPGHFVVNTVASSAATVWADGTSSWTIEVQALDMCNADVARVGVNFTVTGDAQLSQTSVVTDDGGRASIEVRDSTAESVTVTISGDGMDSSEASIEFTARPPVPAPTVVTANASEISGTAQSGTVVKLTYPAASGPVTVDIPVGIDGHWSLTTFTPVSGEASLFAIDTDHRQSTVVSFTLDADAPAPAVIDVSCGPTISGSVTPPLDEGTTVSIVWADGATTLLLVANSQWSATVPQGTADGVFQIVVKDPAGNQSITDGTYVSTCSSPTPTSSPTPSPTPTSSPTPTAPTGSSTTTTPTSSSASTSSTTAPTSTTTSPTSTTTSPTASSTTSATSSQSVTAHPTSTTGSPTSTTTSPTASTTSPTSTKTVPTSTTTSPTSTSSTSATSSQSGTGSPTSTTTSPTSTAPTSTTSAPTSSPTQTPTQKPTSPTQSPTQTMSPTSTTTSPASTTTSPTSTTTVPTSTTMSPTSTSSTSATSSQSGTGSPTSTTTSPTATTAAPTSSPTQTPTQKPTSPTQSSTQTMSPTSTTTSPTASTTSPTSTTTVPTSTTTSPTSTSSTSATSSQSGTGSPTSTTTSPTSTTTAPTSMTTAPTYTTTSPTSTMTAPTSTSSTSATSSQSGSVSPTSTTTAPTSTAPTSTTATPTSSTTQTPTEKPTSPTQSPTQTVSSTQSPTSTTTSPTSMTTSPTSTTNEPTSTTTSPTSTSSTSEPSNQNPTQSSTSVSTSPSPAATGTTTTVGPTSILVPGTRSINIVQTGQNYTFYGLGFVPGEQVSAYISSDVVGLDPQVADATGMVTFQWTAPAIFVPGEHEIVMTATSGSITQTFVVSASASASTGTPSAIVGSAGAVVPTGGTASPYHSLLPIAVFLLVAFFVVASLRRTTK